MGLQNGGVAVDINHQTGQKIALAVYQTESIVVGANQPEGLTNFKRFVQSVEEEIGVDIGVGEREYSHHYAANLEMSVANVAAVAGIYRNNVAFLNIFIGMSNGS